MRPLSLACNGHQNSKGGRNNYCSLLSKFISLSYSPLTFSGFLDSILSPRSKRDYNFITPLGKPEFHKTLHNANPIVIDILLDLYVGEFQPRPHFARTTSKLTTNFTIEKQVIVTQTPLIYMIAA